MSHPLSIKFKKILKNQKGHTFLELIVVISIFAIMSSVLLFNFGDFSTNLAVQNLAADIALTIKQAQSEAISGKSNVLFSTNAAPTYGVAFDTMHPSSFAYFADQDGDRVLNTANSADWECGDPSSECLREISILTGDTIFGEGLCINDGAGLSCGYTDLSVTFQRPFPDASIKSANAFSLNGVSGQVTVISARGMQKKINVNSLGQISIE